EGRAGAAVNAEKDDMYEESVRVIMETGQASVSILQRRLRLGYTRAARIIDMMEQEGMVGPYEGSKPRRILIDREEWLKQEVIGNNER
ncbi:MAG: DNA translocase FtsK, partial [Candidatus Omnitrophica bacterium]|nr:DNA translocase FtsK [Candidatus Omnitrophota bacterium]